MGTTFIPIWTLLMAVTSAGMGVFALSTVRPVSAYLVVLVLYCAVFTGITGAVRLEIRDDSVVVRNFWLFPTVVALDEVDQLQRDRSSFLNGPPLVLKDGRVVRCQAAIQITRRDVDRINTEIAARQETEARP
ncbi:MAG: hypothetical protein QNJ81_07395 [Acidimicrobiia bacterium]|nr:hypothetical protein [Acidimicrobiia bacterium]